MNVKRMAIMLGASLAVFGGVFGFVAFRDHMMAQYFANMPKPVVAVTVEPATLEEWGGVLPAVGTLSAVNGVDVAPAVAGLVKEIAFESGRTVRRGALLVRLDSDVETGNLRSAEAEAELARASVDRARRLVRTDAVSQAALDKAEAEFKVKLAAVEALRAQIGKKSVFAPFDGTLGVRKVDLGQFVQAGQAIVNLQDLSAMRATFSVSQKDIAAIGTGGPLRMTADSWPDRVFEGEISAIEPQVDSATGMLAVEGRFANAEGLLRPGMFVRVEIARPSSAKVVAVPVSAVAYSLHGDAVFVVRDGKAERVFVELGERRDGKVAVLKGIEAGDAVVTSGQVKLEHGSAVEVRSDQPLAEKVK